MDEQTIKKSIFHYSTEERRIYRSSIKKFTKSHSLYVILLSSLTLLQFIAIAFFMKGFLVSKPDTTTLSQQLPGDIELRRFDKAVILIIDFLIPIEQTYLSYNTNYHNHITALSETYNNKELNSSSLLNKFLLDPPTTTLHRLKGLTTGWFPSFVDGNCKLGTCILDEDNIIKQLHLQNKEIYFLGDDTWSSMFDTYLSPYSKPYVSFNAWDLDTVDQGVISNFDEHLINKPATSEWDVIIGHLLGIDNPGNKLGPDHGSVKGKQQRINTLVIDVLDSIDDDTLLLIMGDHGIDQNDNHGEESIEELESELFICSKKPIMWNINDSLNDYLLSFQNSKRENDIYRNVNQIDIVPTVLLLLDLPIPKIARTKSEYDLYSMLKLNQIGRHKDESKLFKDECNDQHIGDLFEQVMKDTTKGRKYQQEFLRICKEKWITFDYWSMGIGMVLLLISVMLLIVITKLIPSVIVNQMVPEFVQSILLMSAISNICLSTVYLVLRRSLSNSDIIWCTLLATSIGIIIGCSIPIFSRYQIRGIFLKFFGEFSDHWSMIGAMFLLIHALLFASNSYTIWEDKIVSFLLITFGNLTLYEFVFIPRRQTTSALVTAVISEQKGTSSGVTPSTANSYALPLTRFARLLGGYHSIMLIVCTRLATVITTCREGQYEHCTPTFTTTAIYSLWCMILLFFSILVIPICIKGYYNLSSSYQAAAPIWIDILLRGFLFANFFYWSLTAVEHNIDNLEWDIAIVKFTISRIITCFSVVVCNICWMLGPLCIKLNVENADMRSQQTTILGYSNIYGAPFFLLVINTFMSIVFFNKPLAQVSLALMCNQLLAIIEIIDLLKLKENIVGPIILGLLSYQQFFSTGHQFTISSIQWDIGLILSDTLTFPITHISIIINTFGPYILVALSVALLTLWRQPPDILKPQTILGRIVSNCGILITYHTILCFSSFIWATHFRRYDMVWEIFFSRFLFASMILMTTQLVVTFGTIAFASGRLIRHINDTFWK